MQKDSRSWSGSTILPLFELSCIDDCFQNSFRWKEWRKSSRYTAVGRQIKRKFRTGAKTVKISYTPTPENPLTLKDSLSVRQTDLSRTYYSTNAKKSSLKRPEKPENSVPKRCPTCRAHLWVVRTDTQMSCWKCQEKLRIVQALRDSTYHRHGVILQVISWLCPSTAHTAGTW